MPGGSGDFDVGRLASLARLPLGDDERALFASQLATVLAFAAEVLAVDTAGVSPTTHPFTPELPERPDTTQPSLSRETVLELAPDRDAGTGLVRVPRVIER